jgi:SAM-dependent methyltransferase
MRDLPQRQDILGILEGYYLASITEALHCSGALIALQAGTPTELAARELGLDPILLTTLVSYLRARTVGIIPDGPVTRAAPDIAFLSHLLDQYKGAFGPCLDQLESILHSPGSGATLVNWKRHSLAFGTPGRGASNSFALQLLAELGVDYVADLGCSAGGLLLDFAHANPAAHGWGIDSSPAAIAEASRVADAERIGRRICFRVASAYEPESAMRPDERAQVQLLTAFNLANAFFDPRSGQSVKHWLARLQVAFPDCLLLLGDYYGKVGTCPAQDSHRYRRAMMHDVAQALTSQGIPPPDSGSWRTLLEQGGATLIKAFEGEHDEVAHFVYLIQL